MISCSQFYGFNNKDKESSIQNCSKTFDSYFTAVTAMNAALYVPLNN